MSESPVAISSSPGPILITGEARPSLDKTPTSGGSWTDAEDAVLRQHWGNDCTAAEIARVLSRKFRRAFSRNAVIGRAGRLKLGNQRRVAVTPKPTIAGTRALGNMMQRLKAGKPLRKSVKPTPDVELPTKPLAPDPIPATACVLLDLTNETCRWPLGAAHEPVTLFCGSPGADLAGGMSYCVFHSRLAYAARAAFNARKGAAS